MAPKRLSMGLHFLSGPIVFVLILCAGELAHVPGVVFVAAAVVAYGRASGGLLAFVGAVIALSVSFMVVRAIGGTPLSAIRLPLARRLWSQLDAHPIRIVFSYDCCCGWSPL